MELLRFFGELSWYLMFFFFLHCVHPNGSLTPHCVMSPSICFCRPNQIHCIKSSSHAFLASQIWRVLLLLGNFILLFGNPIQMLWLPSQADLAMDILYILVLVTFTVDMIFRSVAVGGYFGITVVRVFPSFSSSLTHSHSSSMNRNGLNKGNNSGIINNSNSASLLGGNKGDGGSPGGSITGNNGNNSSSKSHGNGRNGNKNMSQKEKTSQRTAKCLEAVFGWVRCLQMGSFLFWCDLFSTLTLFYDISFTNPKNYEMVQWDMQLSGARGIQPVRVKSFEARAVKVGLWTTNISVAYFLIF